MALEETYIFQGIFSSMIKIMAVSLEDLCREIFIDILPRGVLAISC